MSYDINWMKKTQTIGRGIRNGELSVIMSDYDPEEQKLTAGTFFRPHYAEYYNFDTNETYWKTFTMKPKFKEMCLANNIVRNNSNGTYEYVKNRETGELRLLTEDEIIWMLLQV